MTPVPLRDSTAARARLMAKAAAWRIPISGTLELTERCNLACVHCYIRRPEEDARAARGEMDVGCIFGLLDDLAEAGCLWLGLTGGEPLLHPGFRRIYSRATRLGFLVTVMTNATRITESIADAFAREPPHAVEVTLHGRTRRTYERMTGLAGSFTRCVQGIEMLLARRIPVVLKTTFTSLNSKDVGPLRRFARDLGIPYRFDAAIQRRLDGRSLPRGLRLPPSHVVRLEQSARAHVRRDPALVDPRILAEGAAGDRRPRAPMAGGTALFDCGAGRSMFHIDCRGRLSPCLMARRPSFDLRSRSFARIWRGQMRRAVRAQRSANAPCGGCVIAEWCENCPGWGIVEAGDPEARVDYVCALAHARVASVGLPSRSISRRT